MSKIIKADEFGFGGLFYCVITQENGKQYYKTSTIGGRLDDAAYLSEIQRNGAKWDDFVATIKQIDAKMAVAYERSQK